MVKHKATINSEVAVVNRNTGRLPMNCDFSESAVIPSRLLGSAVTLCIQTESHIIPGINGMSQALRLPGSKRAYNGFSRMTPDRFASWMGSPLRCRELNSAGIGS